MGKPLSIILGLLLAWVPPLAGAESVLVNPHAMVYFHFSFEQPDMAGLGLRMDNLVMGRGAPVGVTSITRRPALLDLRFNRRGLTTLSVAGRDYGPGRGVILAQNGSDVQQEAGTGAGTQRRRSVPERVFGDVSDVVVEEVSGAKTGFLIGAGFGLALLMGVGD